MKEIWKGWYWVAGAFIAINVLGAIYAYQTGEGQHGTIHVLLVLLALAGWTAIRARAAISARREPQLPPVDPRLEYLQQSVDAVAIEVERIGEAQRFNEKMRAGRGETTPPKNDAGREGA